MKLRQKMFLGSAFLAVIPVIITAFFTSQIAGDLGQQALTQSARNHITSIRDTKKSHVEGYFELVSNQIRTFASFRETINAMYDLNTTFPLFTEEAGLTVATSNNDEGPPIPIAQDIH